MFAFLRSPPPLSQSFYIVQHSEHLTYKNLMSNIKAIFHILSYIEHKPLPRAKSRYGSDFQEKQDPVPISQYDVKKGINCGKVNSKSRAFREAPFENPSPGQKS